MRSHFSHAGHLPEEMPSIGVEVSICIKATSSPPSALEYFGYLNKSHVLRDNRAIFER
jgi:hypothetical protein